ncbi:MAG: HAD family hydrolase [Patescibacteria group bacterium]
MKIFLDFDDTLFNTRAFAERVQGVFEEYGISRELFWSSYQDMKGAFLIGWCYSPEVHMQRLQPDHSFDIEQVRKKLGVLVADTRRFLFHEVKESLSFLKAVGHTLYILSLGDYGFQMEKIRGTGIDVFMEKVIVTQGDKAKALRDERVKGEGTWFIDDRVRFIESVKKTFPEVKTILMQRVGRYHQDEPNNFCDYVAQDLAEVVSILQRKQ